MIKKLTKEQRSYLTRLIEHINYLQEEMGYSCTTTRRERAALELILKNNHYSDADITEGSQTGYTSDKLLIDSWYSTYKTTQRK